MQLTATQADALTELINIGYGRAAAALSEMTGYRIKLDVPTISMHEIERVGPVLMRDLAGEVACVNQVFSGPIAGNAMLLLDTSAAIMLSQLLDDEAASPKFDTTAREVISEAGNVLLNACLGVFGNLLEVQVTFAVPRLQVESLSGVLESITTGAEDLTHALLVQTRFQLRASNVSGYFVIIFGITSLERVLGELDNWEHRHR